MERRIYTVQDAGEFEKASEQLRQNGFDDWTTEGIKRNADLMDEYFQQNRAIPVTVANIYKAVEARKQNFAWVSLAQAKYNLVAVQETDRANALANWLATQGKPGQLISTGDQAFENLTLLLTVLRGYEISPARIRDAEDRIAHQPGKKLHYVQAPRRTEPISPAAKADDGTPFLGDTAERLNEPAWVKRSRERAEREAKEAANQPSSTSLREVAIREARRKAEELRGATHSESNQLQKIFVTQGTEIDWVQTLAARQQMAAQFAKAQAVRRFVR
jgi:hypothetical protein